MKLNSVYLFFNGDCRQAMAFYQQCFGGNLSMQTFAKVPAGEMSQTLTPQQSERIMHAQLTAEDLHLMASDGIDDTIQAGDNVGLVLECDSQEQVDSFFASLSAGGKVLEEPGLRFWGDYFAMVRDQFAVAWMLTFTPS